MKSVYLDNQATTPLDPKVLEAMLPYFTEHFGNSASSAHAWGRRASAAVETAREQVATLIGADALSIIFTSGATESVNLALKGLAEHAQRSGNQRRTFVSCKTEHPAVLDCLTWLTEQGFRVVILGVDRLGHVDLNELEQVLDEQTLCLSLMMANNEIGTVHHIQEASALARKAGAFFHSDATQAVGKLPVDVDELGIDLLSLSGHKFYGPKGAGALFRRRKKPRVRLLPSLHGGGHERGLRSGTLNVPLLVGLGQACDLAREQMPRDAVHARDLSVRLTAILDEHRITYQLNGDTHARLPGNLNLRFPGHGAGALMKALPEIAMSAGSACSSATPGPSPVLLAIGLDADAAAESLRLGVGRFTSVEDLEYAGRRLAQVILNPQYNRAQAESCQL